MVQQRIILHKWLVGMALLMCTGVATAVCDFATFGASVTVTAAPAIATTSPYDPFSGAGSRKASTITITNSHATLTCTGLYLKFTDTSNPSLLSTTIPFKITITSGTTDLIGDATGIAVGNIAPAGGTATVNIDFFIPGPATTAWATGTYTDTDIGLVLKFTDPTDVTQGTALIVSTTVADTLDVSMNTTYQGLASKALNLGTFNSGSETGSVSFNAFSNVVYDIKLSSDNAGKMKINTTIPTHTSGLREDLDYLAKIDSGTNYSLTTTPTIAASNFAVTAIAGTTHALNITLNVNPATAYPLAGTYNDTVHIEVAKKT